MQRSMPNTHLASDEHGVISAAEIPSSRWIPIICDTCGSSRRVGCAEGGDHESGVGRVRTSELRAAAKQETDTRQARPILAIAMVLDGYSREAAAQACRIDRQSLRDWVHCYDEAGVATPLDRAGRGRAGSLSAPERARVARWVEQGADLAQEDGALSARRHR